MPSFLFWNLQGNSGRRTPDRAARLTTSIGRLAMSKRIDVFVFCEFHLDRSKLIEDLERATGRTYHVHKTRSRRIVFVSNLEEHRVREVHSEPLTGDRMAVHRLELPGGRDVLLAGLHLPDRMSNPDPPTREFQSRTYAMTLRRLETDTGIDDLIAVGDFNMNPYETAMSSAVSLHALPDRAMLGSVERMKSRREHPVFYNP